MKTLHPKIKQLKQRATPMMSSSYVNAEGELVDFKIAVPEDRTVEGYLAVWGRKDDYGTVPIRGCFAKSIQERGPKSASKYKIVMLWQHKIDEPIGQFVELEEDDYGLRFKAVLDDVPTADRALKQIRSGTINQFSYGFDYVWDKMTYSEEMDAILMYECALYEGSACTLGAETETFAIRAKQNFEQCAEELQEEIDDFIRTIPRRQQLELRQLLTKHISLYNLKPDSQRAKPLEESEEPDAPLVVGDLKINVNNF
jgi:hypothetical protein